MRHRGMSIDAMAAALLEENAHRCVPPLAEAEVRSIAASVGRYAPTATTIAPLVGYTLDELCAHAFPTRRVLLARGDTAIFREGHIGQVYAERGVGKTWFLQTLALVISAGTEALGFRTAHPSRVLYVDGEMASEEVQERFTLLGERLKVTPADRLTIVAADWQDGFLPRLDTDEGQDLLEPFVAPADLIILDNRSSLCDPEGEKDPVAWQPAQDWLLSLRRRGKGVLLAHHANRQGGARGHSKAEDPMNLLIRLARPEGYSH
jgi:putative DNA primase/helicase